MYRGAFVYEQHDRFVMEHSSANGQSVDLSIKLGNVVFRNPVLVASGTFGYGAEAKAFCDIEGNPTSRIRRG